MKKFGAIVLAIMMIAMVGAAWADTATGDYSASEVTKTIVNGNNIPLNKTIVYFNPDGTSVREPNLTYTYTIAPVTIAANTTVTVTDTDGDVATVNSGDSDGVATSASIAITPGTAVSASATGVPKNYSTNIAVTPTNFPHAGIYRYSITESISDANVAAAGVTRASAANNEVRYLDVYIKNQPVYNTLGDESSGIASYTLALQGAVIFKTNSSIDGHTSGSITSDKTTGFDVANSSDTDFSDDTTVDKYFTYNLAVTKTTTGSFADKTHEFPITLTATKASGLTNNATVDVSVTNGTLLTNTSATMTLDSAVSFGASLKDGGVLTIKGIPYYPGYSASTPVPAAYATFSALSETNDSVDIYTVSSSVTNVGGTVTAPGAVAAGATGNFTLSNAALVDASSDTGIYAATIAITNTMAEISPTGYVTRFAPYALILIGGIVLLIIAKKHKKTTDED